MTSQPAIEVPKEVWMQFYVETLHRGMVGMFVIVLCLGAYIVHISNQLGEARGQVIELKAVVAAKDLEIQNYKALVQPIEEKILQGAKYMMKKYKLNSDKAVEYSWAFMQHALRTNLPYLVVMATVEHETHFRSIESWDKSSHGLMQVNLGVWQPVYGFKKKDLYETDKNVRYGTDIMRHYYDKTKSLYGALRRYRGSVNPWVNDAYASDVLQRSRAMAREFQKYG